MDLRELAIVVAMAPTMVVIRLVIQRLFKASEAADVYTLSDSKGHKVDMVLEKHASAEERARIINEKVRELTQRQSV